MRRTLLALALAGCAPGQAGLGAEPLGGEVEIRDRAGTGPEGADPAPRVEVVLPDGSARAGIAAARLRGGAALVREDRSLVAIDADGAELPLSPETTGLPISDAAGDRLAFAEPEEEGGTTLRLFERGGGAPRTLGRAGGAMSPVRLVGDTVVLVGAGRGGVAGVWVADAGAGGGLRCLTNCALRTGSDWGGAYVPPPDPATIAIEGGRLTYRAPDGSQHGAALR